MRHFRSASIALLVLAVSPSPGFAGDELTPLRPLADPADLAGSFGFVASDPNDKPKKQAKEIAEQRRAASGLACPKPGVCLVVFDEGSSARLVRLTTDAYAPIGGPIALSANDEEADAEGAAADEVEGGGSDKRFYYIAGSHASKRNSGKENPASRLLTRFEIAADGGVVTPGATADLWAVVGDTELAAFRTKPLGTQPLEKAPKIVGERGLDIEGVAVDGARLYFGLRGPSGPTTAKILSVDKAIFDGGPSAADPKLVEVEVGEKRAIRDMQRVKDGFLILAGPDDDATDSRPADWASWRLLFWNGKGTATAPQGEFDLSGVKPRERDGCDDNSKAGKLTSKLEGIAVVEDRSDGWRVVTVSDGLCDGGPMWFDVKRR